MKPVSAWESGNGISHCPFSVVDDTAPSFVLFLLVSPPPQQDMVQMFLSGDSLCLGTLGAISWHLGGAVTFGCV